MAYPYSNPVNYNPTFYPPYTPTYTPPTQVPAQTPAQNSAQSQAVNNGLIWVQGEAGAKSYIVPPNSSVLLMDSEAQRFYIKSTDVSGMPLPLKVYEYHEAQKAAVREQRTTDPDKYITRDEFEKRLAELSAKKIAKKDVNDDE